MPSFEQRVSQARTIEISLITEIFASDRPPSRLPRIEAYDYREGTAAQLGIHGEIRKWLDANPGQVTAHHEVLYRKDARTGLYRRLTLPTTVYDDVVELTEGEAARDLQAAIWSELRASTERRMVAGSPV